VRLIARTQEGIVLAGPVEIRPERPWAPRTPRPTHTSSAAHARAGDRRTPHIGPIACS